MTLVSSILLCCHLCCRYAMSVIWELDADYEVVDVWYGRTVIRSAYKLFYEVGVYNDLGEYGYR